MFFQLKQLFSAKKSWPTFVFNKLMWAAVINSPVFPPDCNKHNSSHTVAAHLFEWCTISSASRQAPCSRGPSVTVSIAIATQPNNPWGDISTKLPIVTTTSTTAHTVGKLPRGWGMRASWSRRDCICKGTVSKGQEHTCETRGKDHSVCQATSLRKLLKAILRKSDMLSGSLQSSETCCLSVKFICGVPNPTSLCLYKPQKTFFPHHHIRACIRKNSGLL